MPGCNRSLGKEKAHPWELPSQTHVLGSVHLLPFHVTFVHPSLGSQDSEGSPMRETLPSSGHRQRYCLKTEVYPKSVTLDITTPPSHPAAGRGTNPPYKYEMAIKVDVLPNLAIPSGNCLRDLMPRPTCGCSSSLAYNREDRES